jgi:hypothetical protein
MIGGEDNLSLVFDGNNWYLWSREVKGYFLHKDLSTLSSEPNGRPGTMPEEGWPEGEVRGKGLLVRWVLVGLECKCDNRHRHRVWVHGFSPDSGKTPSFGG